MKRLTKQQKEIIKKLVDKKYSIRKIANKLQLPKSDVYYWYRKFFRKKLKEIKTIGSSNPKRIKSVLPPGVSGKAF